MLTPSALRGRCLQAAAEPSGYLGQEEGVGHGPQDALVVAGFGSVGLEVEGVGDCFEMAGVVAAFDAADGANGDSGRVR